MTEVTTIGLDLAKHVFQAHGANADGAAVFRKKLRRDKVLAFFAAQPRCRVAMEACPGAHHWGRLISGLGHDVRLVPPAYVKPFVKRHKNDAADAEAIAEAATRPTMRFVAVKSEEKQAAAVVFRTRDLLVGQRTQLINALRGHLSEYGVIAPQGPSHIERLVAQVEDPHSDIPSAARRCLAQIVATLRQLGERIRILDAEIAARAKRDDVARRLMTVPGIGPIVATALEALAPPCETFSSGRDFAAWIGLTPLQRSTGGKQRLGRISRMGERTLRCLLVNGASGVVRWARRKGAPAVLVGAYAGAQAADAGDRRAGEQDGAHRLGLDGQGWRLRSSDHRCLRRRRRSRGCRPSEEVEGQVWRNVGEAGSGEPGARPARLERVPVMWT